MAFDRHRSDLALLRALTAPARNDGPDQAVVDLIGWMHSWDRRTLVELLAVAIVELNTPGQNADVTWQQLGPKTRWPIGYRFRLLTSQQFTVVGHHQVTDNEAHLVEDESGHRSLMSFHVICARGTTFIAPYGRWFRYERGDWWVVPDEPEIPEGVIR